MTWRLLQIGGEGPNGAFVEFYVVPEDLDAGQLVLAMAGAHPAPDEMFARIIAVCDSEDKARRVVDALNKTEIVH